MQASFKQQVLTATGPCIKLQQPLCSLISRVQRLFFLNEAQNLSSFLIADLGVAKYPSYAVTRSRSVFTCRQDLLDYERALEHAAELDNALEVSKAKLIEVKHFILTGFRRGHQVNVTASSLHLSSGLIQEKTPQASGYAVTQARGTCFCGAVKQHRRAPVISSCDQDQYHCELHQCLSGTHLYTAPCTR